MRTIVLVDDEPSLTEGLAVALDCRGYSCVKATDMTAAVAAIRKHDVSVLVTDIMMSPGSEFPTVESNECGFRLIEYVQQNWAGLPIVCLSVVADQAKIRLLKNRGVRYLRKGETPLATAIDVITALADGRRVRPRSG